MMNLLRQGSKFCSSSSSSTTTSTSSGSSIVVQSVPPAAYNMVQAQFLVDSVAATARRRNRNDKEGGRQVTTWLLMSLKFDPGRQSCQGVPFCPSIFFTGRTVRYRGCLRTSSGPPRACCYVLAQFEHDSITIKLIGAMDGGYS